MRRTRGNGWKATGKNAAMNKPRNDLGRGFPEPWERIQGIRKDRVEEDGVPEWRWMKSRSSRVN
jgi:hypothetical protein